MESYMLVLITVKETNPRTFRQEIIVSHGVDTETFSNVPLQQETLEYYQRHCGAIFDQEHGWCLP